MIRALPLSCAAALYWALHLAAPAAADQARFNALANLPFAQNRPTAETRKTLMEELAFQQATQAYLWAMPLINTLGMKFGSEAVFGAGYNVLPVWKERLGRCLQFQRIDAATADPRDARYWSRVRMTCGTL